MNKAPLPIRDYTDLAKVMNMVQFHTKMVDSVEELLHETAEVSILGSVPFLSFPFQLLSSSSMFFPLCSFYPRVFEKMFSQSCEEMSMKRYLMAFPAVCCHFSQCGHPLCPEEVSLRLSYHVRVRTRRNCATLVCLFRWRQWRRKACTCV